MPKVLVVLTIFQKNNIYNEKTNFVRNCSCNTFKLRND